jgi:hypothetical protein
MIYKFSNLVETIKTKADFNKWVDNLVSETEKSIYQNRNEIYKNEVARELADLATLKNAWDGIQALRQKSADYDLCIIVDNKGYHTFRAYFPITPEEHTRCKEYREQRIAELGGDSDARASVYIEECVWELLHDRVFKEFSFVAPFPSYKSFDKMDYTPLVRKMEIARFK